MFEHRSKPLLPMPAFAMRLLSQVLITLAITAASLLLGIAGYHYTEDLPWIDSLLNASMILGGMGEIDLLKTTEGKLFASFYALYGGLYMIICGGLLLAPVFHRILHHFHADAD